MPIILVVLLLVLTGRRRWYFMLSQGTGIGEESAGAEDKSDLAGDFAELIQSNPTTRRSLTRFRVVCLLTAQIPSTDFVALTGHCLKGRSLARAPKLNESNTAWQEASISQAESFARKEAELRDSRDCREGKEGREEREAKESRARSPGKS